MPIRDLLPSVVQDDAAAGTMQLASTVTSRHVDECRQAFDGDAESLAGSMRSFPWLAAALAWLRSVAARIAPDSIGGLGGAAAAGSPLVTAMAVITLPPAAMAPTRVRRIDAHPACRRDIAA